MKDEAALLKERARLALDHPMNPMTTPLGPDSLLGVLPDEAIPKVAYNPVFRVELWWTCCSSIPKVAYKPVCHVELW